MIPSSETQDSGEAQPSSEPVLLNEFQRAAFRTLSLSRLAALVQLRAASRDEPGADAALHRRLLDRAIFSVYEDCVAAGALAEAREMLGGE